MALAFLDPVLIASLQAAVVAALNGGGGATLPMFQWRTAGGVGIGSVELILEPAQAYLSNGVELKGGGLPVGVRATAAATAARYAFLDRDGAEVITGDLTHLPLNQSQILAGTYLEVLSWRGTINKVPGEAQFAGNLVATLLGLIRDRCDAGTTDATADLEIRAADETVIETIPLLNPAWALSGSQLSLRGPITHSVIGTGVPAKFRVRNRDNVAIFSGLIPVDLAFTSLAWEPGRTVEIADGAVLARLS